MDYAKKKLNLNPYIASIIHKKGIHKQFVGSLNEFENKGYEDPLCEYRFEQTRGLIHRYPDRVVLVVTNRCFAYCRFCFRKNNWMKFGGFDLSGAINYLKEHTRIREVIISGGDPFTLNNKQLNNIVSSVVSVKHINTIRIGTRVLSSFPERISLDSVNLLNKYKIIWIAAHINHPDEITDNFIKAASLLIDNGIPVVSQTVLLSGINDDVHILKKLFCSLVSLRIKPYYLFGLDQAIGNSHLRVSIDKALSIMDALRGRISGLCIPSFSFDLTDGGGKVVLEPNRIMDRQKNIYKIRNFENREYKYVDI